MNDVLPLGLDRPQYDPPLPAWVTALRPTQVDAVREIIELFDSGVDVVYCDAPVGAGKTLIGELVRRELAARGMVKQSMYMCSDKALQDQFVRDFPEARVLKGRGNYSTLTGPYPRITAEDCTATGAKSPCRWCPRKHECPYQEAKAAAQSAEVAVFNTSYMLHAMNFTDSFPKFDLVIADECDMLEGALIGFIEYEVPRWIAHMLGLEAPRKAVRKPTLIGWLHDTASTCGDHLSEHGETMDVKQRNRMRAFMLESKAVAEMLQRDVDSAAAHEDDDSDGDASGHWIRDYGDDRNPVEVLRLRPVKVDQYGAKNLWKHGRKWLLMSGTIISSGEMSDSLGLPLEYATVVVPSSFPVENRPIILAPVADVTYRGVREEGALEKVAYAIEQIAEAYDGRILVHTVSYANTKFLYDAVKVERGRPKVMYAAAREKNDALAEYLRKPGAVLFAPSMDRGVDLMGDKCEVQIIAKCPFPNLKDKQVSSRMHLPGGQEWYAVKTVRDMVQMTGRGVRSEVDECVTFILDAQFTKNVWGKYKHLFPAYFREAVNQRTDIRWLLKPHAA